MFINLNEIENDYHFIMVCPLYAEYTCRTVLFSNASTIIDKCVHSDKLVVLKNMCQILYVDNVVHIKYVRQNYFHKLDELSLLFISIVHIVAVFIYVPYLCCTYLFLFCN